MRRPLSAAMMIVGAALIGVLGLPGCVEAPSTANIVVGSTLDVARKNVPEGTPLLVYDLSKPVLGLAATYSAAGLGAGWVVIVHCDADNGTALGVIPTQNSTPEILDQAADGDLDHYLLECSA